MGLGLVAAGIKLGTTLYGAYKGKKNKPKLFENTFEGRELLRRSKTGALTPRKMTALNQMMATRMGGASNIAKANISGRLERSGMGDSIAATTPIARIDAERTRNLGQAGVSLGMINEQSKQQAEMDLARGKDQSRIAKDAWRNKYYSDLGMGLTGTAATGLQGYEDYQGDQYKQDAMSKLMPIISSNDPEEVLRGMAFMQMYMSGNEPDIGLLNPMGGE